MSTLYELTSDFQTLYDALDDIDLSDDDGANLMTAYFDTLEGIEGEFEQKAENLALFVKQLLADAEAIKKEKMNLENRQSQKMKKAEQLKRYLRDCMDAIGTRKIDTPKVKVTVGNNGESVKITNLEQLKNCDKAWKAYAYKETDVDKTAVKALLQSGQIIPGAELQRTRRITIK